MTMPPTTIKDRQQMYRLIISQLFYDGYQQVAVTLSQTVNVFPPCPPSDKLFHLINASLKTQENGTEPIGEPKELPARCLDLEYESDSSAGLAPEPGSYETVYLTSHKGMSRAATFNKDGSLIATGSVDASIKILDVDRMVQRGSVPQDQLNNDPAIFDIHPVIRTLYDHLDEVRCLAFHPRLQMLASGSMDYTVKFFDFSKSSTKRACKTIQEVEPVRAVSFHPSGDYILVGTRHPVVRLYDVHTQQSFVSCVPSDQHKDAIVDLNYSLDGRLYATCSKDGDMKLWDGVSNRCINTFLRAHDGSELCSAVFSKNSKYILTAGKDSMVKLWEIAANRCLIAYTGAGATGKMTHRAVAQFNHTEDYAMFTDEKSGSLCTWDARNADRKRLLALGHTAPVRHFTHSPTQAAFVTTSEDYRCRFWYRKTDAQ